MSITLVKAHATRIANGKARVKPGQSFRLNEAAAVGDGVWQGDLGIEIIAAIPTEFVACGPFAQLVPGNTTGSRHTIEDVATIGDFHRPSNWTSDADYEGLLGPAFLAVRETNITHPTHGAVLVAAGHMVQIRYQRNQDLIAKQARRARD